MKNNHHYFYKYLLGLLFGFGLIYSGMIYPSKVVHFLDIFGDFDPSLIFVMLGGIVVYSIFFFTTKNKETLLGYEKNIPHNGSIDSKLIIGSIIFGIGWGVYGYCPAPALVGLGLLNTQAILFVISMVIGMYVFEICGKYTK